MRTYLIFDTEKLIKKINSLGNSYKSKREGNILKITKKYKGNKGRPFFSSLPKEIKISPEAVGLMVGEGYFGERHFVFANCNEKAIDVVLEFLKQFKIPVKFYLEIAVKGESKEIIKKCKNFWEKYLRIKIDRIRIREEFYNSGNFGTIHLALNNSIVAKLIKQIVLISKKKAEQDKNTSVNYLKGIIAAEGNINVKKSTSCVYMIRISAKKIEERKHYKKCLKRAGIKIYCEDMPTISCEEGIKKGWKTTRGRAGAVIISKWENFVKTFELDLLELDKKKQSKFTNYFINNKFTKQFLDFDKFIGREFTMKEAQNLFGFEGRYVNRVLTLLKKGYLSRRKLNKVKFMYKLTDKYLYLYQKLNSTLNNPTYQ